MAGAFDADVRVLVCGNCGATLPPASASGGQIQCQYCQTVTVVYARDERALGNRGPIDEAQRVAFLWSQIHVGMQVHPELPALNENGMLPERNLQRAMQLWEETRRKQAVDPAAMGDDLLFLTGSLAGYFGTHSDPVRVRALWESALESSREPRHQQWIRGSLSRLAAKAGDFEAAGRWLQPCDPQSNELICDTSYRLSYALLATVQSRFNDVILALAPTPDVLPFFFSQRVLCHVIRANAFEKLGDVGTATNQLQALVSADPSLVGILPLMAKANAELDLCPQSMPRALGH